MADQLRLSININNSDAARKLERINKLLDQNDAAYKKLQGSLAKSLGGNTGAATSGASKLSGELRKLNKEAVTFNVNSGKWNASTTLLTMMTQRYAMQLTTANTRTIMFRSALNSLQAPAKAVGNTLKSTFSSTLSHIGNVTKGIAGIGSALVAAGAAKSTMDYMGYSKGVGQLSAIIGGNRMPNGFQRQLENKVALATAGTGGTNQSVLMSATRLASTPTFDPRRSGAVAVGSAEYNKNLDGLVAFAARTSEFAEAMGVSAETMTEGTIKYANIMGKDLQNPQALKEIQDTFKVLLDVSQGDLNYMIPQIAKFGQEALNKGMTEQEAMATFATLTNVFGVEEAGTRTAAITRWLGGGQSDIPKIEEKFGKATADKYKNALYTQGKDGKWTRKSYMDQLLGITDIIADLPDDLQRDIMEGVTFSEIREAGGVRTIRNNQEVYKDAMRGFAGKDGQSDEALVAYWKSNGAKMDLIFKSIANGAQLTMGTLVDVFTNPEAKIEDFVKTLETMGSGLNGKVGGYASGPLRLMISVVEFIKANQKTIERLKDTLGKIWDIGRGLGSIAVNFVLSDSVQSILDFFTSSPEIAITSLIAGPALAKIIGTALVAGFSGAGVAAAIGAALIAGWVILEDWKKKDKDRKEEEDKALKPIQAQTAQQLGAFGGTPKADIYQSPLTAAIQQTAKDVIKLAGEASALETAAKIRSTSPLSQWADFLTGGAYTRKDNPAPDGIYAPYEKKITEYLTAKKKYEALLASVPEEYRDSVLSHLPPEVQAAINFPDLSGKSRPVYYVPPDPKQTVDPSAIPKGPGQTMKPIPPSDFVRYGGNPGVSGHIDPNIGENMRNIILKGFEGAQGSIAKENGQIDSAASQAILAVASALTAIRSPNISIVASLGLGGLTLTANTGGGATKPTTTSNNKNPIQRAVDYITGNKD